MVWIFVSSLGCCHIYVRFGVVDVVDALWRMCGNMLQCVCMCVMGLGVRVYMVIIGYAWICFYTKSFLGFALHDFIERASSTISLLYSLAFVCVCACMCS